MRSVHIWNGRAQRFFAGILLCAAVKLISSHGRGNICCLWTRRPGALVSGAAAVDARKQRLIIRAAEQYLLKYPCDLQPRFDVAEAECSGGFVRHITYLESAFDATGV